MRRAEVAEELLLPWPSAFSQHGRHMIGLIRSRLSSPLLARVVPFALFVILTFLQGYGGEAGRYWVYLAKTLIGAVLLVAVWPLVQEMRWKFSLAGIAVGVGVFVLWVGLDPFLRQVGLPNSYPRMAAGEPWNPLLHFGAGSALAWLFIVVRILGSTLVVPPLEEVFFRSFVYRYLASKDFLSIPLSRFLPFPFLVTSIVFGLEHHEWLAGILCGFAYQGLVIWKGRLGDAIVAHAVTNLLLGLWVVWRGAWQFW